MRIFHVSDCYAPRTGGIESQVRDLARAQQAAGHEVHVLTATPGASGRHGVVEDDDGVTVHRLGTRLAFGVPVNPAAPPAMRSLLRSLAPDVVHVHAGVVSPFAYDGARVALAEGAALAVTWHCMLDGVVALLRGAARRTGWRDAPVALSAVSRAAAERVGRVFAAPVGLLPNGMDLDQWAPPQRTGVALTRVTPGSRTPLRVVATMRLAPRKRGPALVAVVEDAMTQLAPGAMTVEVIGDGPSRAAMARRIARRGLADVMTLRGRLTRDQVRAAYQDAEVFCAPAALEAFGIAALEARSCGLVVIARRGTGIEEFVTDGVDGLLVDDDAGMARALVRLATDPVTLASLGSRARGARPVFDWSNALAAAEREYGRAEGLRRAATG